MMMMMMMMMMMTDKEMKAMINGKLLKDKTLRWLRDDKTLR